MTKLCSYEISLTCALSTAAVYWYAYETCAFVTNFRCKSSADPPTGTMGLVARTVGTSRLKNWVSSTLDSVAGVVCTDTRCYLISITGTSHRFVAGWRGDFLIIIFRKWSEYVCVIQNKRKADLLKDTASFSRTCIVDFRNLILAKFRTSEFKEQ